MKTAYSVLAPGALLLGCFLLVAGLAGEKGGKSTHGCYPREKPLSDAMAAMQFLGAQRIYPGNDLPARGYAEAFDFVRGKMKPDPRAGTKSGGWRAMGPDNVGGRTLALAFNPQNPSTIWAGSASGGLWRSHAAGVGVDAWHYVSTGHPVLGVSSIAITPGDSNTMYIGTGEVYSFDDTQGGIAVRLTRGSFGIGVLKSIDAGRSWTKSLDWSYDQQRGVQVVRIDPTDHDVVWAGTTIGTFKSVDGGDTWEQMNTIAMNTDLAIHPTSPDTVFMCAGNFGSWQTGVYRSVDGGVNWDLCVPTDVLPSGYEGKALLSICESNPDVVYVSVGNGGSGAYATWLIRSMDAGENWARASVDDYSQWQGWFSHDVACNPWNPAEVIAVGIDVWKSVAWGTALVRKSDWSAWYFGTVPAGGPEGPPNYSHADHHDVVWHPTDEDIIYFANDGGIFRSLDRGETFEGCNGGYQTQQFYAGFSSSQTDTNLALGGMQDNSTAIYRGSDTWERVIYGDGGATAIDAADDEVLYGSAQYLHLVRSRDGGEYWVVIEPPDGGVTGFIAPFALGGPAEPDVIYAGRSLIYKSDSEGDFWTTMNGGVNLDGNPAISIAVSQGNSDVVYVATAPVYYAASVFRSTSGGQSFTEVSAGLPDRYPVGLAIDPRDDQRVWVTFSGFGTSHVFRSDNGGDTWIDVGAGLPDVPTSAVIVDPRQSARVYVGTDLGVFVTLDRGATWQNFSAGLPDAVMVMDLNIIDESMTLRASTYGNGLYARPLIGAPSAVADRPSQAVVLAPNRPNPFNPRTEIAWSMRQAGRIRLEVFDLAGRRLRVLADGRYEAGRHIADWDGRDAGGRPAPSGTYVYRLDGEAGARSRTMQLVR